MHLLYITGSKLNAGADILSRRGISSPVTRIKAIWVHHSPIPLSALMGKLITGRRPGSERTGMKASFSEFKKV
jgi:hypothetical protein